MSYQSVPGLSLCHWKRIEILDTVEELILIAAGRSDANFEEKVFVLQRKQGCDPHALYSWSPLAFVTSRRRANCL